MIYGFLYRAVMKAAHKFDWHYAPVIHGVGFKQRWCHWCGFRETFENWEVPPSDGIVRCESSRD